MHHDTSINDDAKQKPEIIIYYNKTKGGVDVIDEMVHSHHARDKPNDGL